MTISPKWGMWISIAAAVISALMAAGAELTTLFGQGNELKIMAALVIFNLIINSINAVLHMIPSVSGPAGAAQFPLGPPPAPPGAKP